MRNKRWGTITIALLAVVLLAACSSVGPRKTDEDMDDTRYVEPTDPNDLPEPEIGVTDIADIDETAVSLDTEPTPRGERIGSETYVEASGDLETVYFDFDKHNLRPDAAQTLKENAAFLLDNPDARVLLEGHCDDRGTNEYNMSLGEKRSKEVRDYLIQAGVLGDRVKIISYGEERPAAPNGAEEGWALNRRAEFKIAR
jgi:peptidoglycan-associated lipoprotein